MRLRHSVIYLQLLLTLQLIFAPELHAQTKWQKFISPDRDFTINFPVKPDYKPGSDVRTGGVIERFSLTVNNHYMEVLYLDLPHPITTKAQLAASLEGIKSGYLRELNKNEGRLIGLKELPEGGYQFDTIIRLNDGTPAQNRMCIYVFGKRQYMISCATWDENGLDEATASRFLDSFRYIYPLQGNPAIQKNLNKLSPLKGKRKQ